MKKLILAFDGVLESLSKWGLVSSFFVILALSVSSIVLRWLGQSPGWLDPLVRYLVFICAFLGGSLATSRGVHIRVDLFTKLVEASDSKALHWIQRNLVALFCLVTTVVLTKASWDFFLVEKEFGAPSFLHIHSSNLVAIIPLGIGLIALRFFNQLILGLYTGESREPDRVQ
ncbi:MAG TPA: TRAP transporter small permease [Bacteriovoracaceae bacterium]|nr:TRAP transporter small permease [Bacteriovoracaceae bacterium]